MIELKYDKNIFYFRKNAKMKEILENKKAIEIVPMKEWGQFLKAKDSIISIEVLKNILLEKISLYDNSENVNAFILGKDIFWLDKATRVGLSLLFNSSEDDMISLATDKKIIELPLEKAKEFLKKLEVYAGKCYLQTAKHKQNVSYLRTIEDIYNYNYTAGYPEKLILNV